MYECVWGPYFWLVLGGAGRLTRQISFNVIFNKIVYDVCLSPPTLSGWVGAYIHYTLFTQEFIQMSLEKLTEG